MINAWVDDKGDLYLVRVRDEAVDFAIVVDDDHIVWAPSRQFRDGVQVAPFMPVRVHGRIEHPRL